MQQQQSVSKARASVSGGSEAHRKVELEELARGLAKWRWGVTDATNDDCTSLSATVSGTSTIGDGFAGKLIRGSSREQGMTFTNRGLPDGPRDCSAQPRRYAVESERRDGHGNSTDREVIRGPFLGVLIIIIQPGCGVANYPRLACAQMLLSRVRRNALLLSLGVDSGLHLRSWAAAVH